MENPTLSPELNEATIERAAQAAYESPGTANATNANWHTAPLKTKADWRIYIRAALIAAQQTK